jgi:ribosome maturation protein Sdo1
LRAALRFARDSHVEIILREIIAHSEDRLAALEREALEAKKRRRIRIATSVILLRAVNPKDRADIEQSEIARIFGEVADLSSSVAQAEVSWCISAHKTKRMVHLSTVNPRKSDEAKTL